MLNYAWLVFKRFAVLLPGIAVAYFSAREVFPYLHERLPFAVAILLTYALGAYLFVPGILRVWRIFVRPTHLPLYCVTPDGFASDPVNIGIVGTRRQLITAMAQAGWHVAEPSTAKTVARTVWAIALNRPYDGMPMSRLYLFGRKQDIGFELQDPEKGRGYRHHVRFWATTLTDMHSDLNATAANLPSEKSFEDKRLWAGAASLDVGISVMRHTLQLAHAVDPNTNRERDLIATQLTALKLGNEVETIRLHQAYSLINRTWFATLRTDGKMIVVQLKN